MIKNILKSTGSLLAGFITVFFLSVGTDIILEYTGFFPPQNEPESYTSGLYLIALLYRSIYTILGGYITALVAPNRPIRHAVILGIAGIIAATFGAVTNWEKTSASTAWYPIALVVAALPSTWLGGKLFVMNNKKVQ